MDKKNQERVNEKGHMAAFCDWNLAFEDLLTCVNLFSLYNTQVSLLTAGFFSEGHLDARGRYVRNF